LKLILNKKQTANTAENIFYADVLGINLSHDRSAILFSTVLTHHFLYKVISFQIYSPPGRFKGVSHWAYTQGLRVKSVNFSEYPTPAM